MGYNKLLISILIFAISGIAVAQEPQPKFVMPYYETIVHEVNLLKLTVREVQFLPTHVLITALNKMTVNEIFALSPEVFATIVHKLSTKDWLSLQTPVFITMLNKMTVNELISLDTNVFKLALSKLGEKEANLFITKVFSVVPAYDSGLLSEAIANKDYVAIRSIAGKYIPADKTQAIIEIMKKVEYQPLIQPPFFIAIGECSNIDMVKKAVGLDIDTILIPISYFQTSFYDEAFKLVGKSNKKIIFAFDFRAKSVHLLDFLERYYKTGLIHSAIVLWGAQNAIDLTPDRYNECFKNANEITIILKSYAPELFVWRQICFYPAENRDRLWAEAIQIKADGDWWWGPHFFNTLMGINLDLYYRRISKDTPIVIGGFFGKSSKLWSDKETEYAKKHKDMFIEYAQSQKTAGVCFIGIDNWGEVLE